MRTFPHDSWRTWVKKKPETVVDLEKAEIYNSRTYPYNGHHKEHLENELRILGWQKDGSRSERRIMKSVRVIINEIVDNWQSAETAFHILAICMRILKYQLLAPLLGTADEFMEPDKNGNRRNWRNPACKQFDDDGQTRTYIFNTRIAIWPDGTRCVEPDGRGGMELYHFPINPDSEHIVLRETMADPERGDMVNELFNGNLYHFKTTKKPEWHESTFSNEKAKSHQI